MSNYTKTTDFEAKDSLPTGDSGKIIRGAEFETEFDAISTAIATKADTAGPTFTGTLTFETISDGTINVTAFVDEDDMSSDSATLVPTQQSVKAYVDSQVTAQDLDFQADTGGALSIDLDSETLTFTGGTGIDTSGSGNAVTFAIDSTVATLTGTQTLTNKTLTSPDVNTPDIDGGTIDGTVIGGTTPAAVSATTVSATGNITVGGTVDGRDVATDGTKLDGIEAGATADQTAAEIRTLVESATDSNVFTDADHTKLDGIEANATADQTDAEIRAAVEAATDSNVFTDADHSKLDGIEAGADVTDTANVTAAGALMDSEVTNLAQVKAFDSADYATAAQGSTADSALQNVVEDTTPQLGGNLDLNSNNITGTGNIDVSGTVTADGLTVDGATDGTEELARFGNNAGTQEFIIEQAGSTGYALKSSVDLRLYADYDNDTSDAGSNIEMYTDGTQRLSIAGSTGDISFYEDTGTTAKLTWDSSAETLIVQGSDAGTAGIFVESSTAGVGARLDTIDATISNTASLTNSLLLDSDNHAIIRMDSNNNGSGDFYITESTSDTARLRIANNGDVSLFEDTGTTAKFYWDASAESLGIGTSSPSGPLDVVGSGGSVTVDANGHITSKQSLDLATAGGRLTGSSNRGVLGQIQIEQTATGADGGYIRFATSASGSTSPTERMRIDASGRVGIGEDNPVEELHISGSVPKIQIQDSDGTNQYGQFYHSAGITAIQARNGNADGIIAFQRYDGTTTDESARIDSSGNLLVGTTDTTPFDSSTERGTVISKGQVQIAGTSTPLYLNRQASDGNLLDLRKDGSTIGSIASVGGSDIKVVFSSDGDQYITGNAASNYLTFSSANAERMRLDSSGNLLVGKSGTNIGTVGVEAKADGQLWATRDGNPVLSLNRETSDGSIAVFYKDAVAVGTIGTVDADLLIYSTASNHAGLRFGNGYVGPTDNTGAVTNGVADLGLSSVRWKDLYLSGGAYLGGTGSANLLDDFEEGDHTTSITCTTSGTVTLNTTFDSISYVKVGRLVTVTGLVIVGTVSSPVGAFSISMPFVAASSGVAKRGSDSAAAITVHNGVSANSADYVSTITGGESELTVSLGDDPDIQTDSAQQLQTGTQIYFHICYPTN